MKERYIKSIFLSLSLILFIISTAAGQYQYFGKNKVQYKDFDWYYIQSEHFDVYYYEGGDAIAEFAIEVMEEALEEYENKMRYRVKERIPILLYKSHNDFQQTNAIMPYMEEGIQGVTELFKNRIVLPYEGDYSQYRHVLRHELVHAFMNDMLYGGGFPNSIYSQSTFQQPLWFAEGLSEYLSMGWDTRADMFMRDASLNGYLMQASPYWGGQSIFRFIDEKYGEEKVAELVRKTKQMRNIDNALKSAIGVEFEDMVEDWELFVKRKYWPDIADRQMPEEFDNTTRMTDHEEDRHFYNISSAISPNGDKIAFISDRDGYMDVYVMSAIDGKINKKIISGQKTPDFEELHFLQPGMSWSPDGQKVALAAKSGEFDALYIVDVKTKKIKKNIFELDGAWGSAWSPKGQHIVFQGSKGGQSDIYDYDVETGQLRQLTNDVFSDFQPSWSPDGSKIAFVSDRGDYTGDVDIPRNFKMYKFDYENRDIYIMNADGSDIERITNNEYSETWPVWGPEGNSLAYSSEKNGIANIFIRDLDTGKERTITNALTGCYQLSWSRDGSKLAFTSFSNGGFDIFLVKNPLEINSDKIELKDTIFFQKLKEEKQKKQPVDSGPVIAAAITDGSEENRTDTETTNSAYRNFVFDPDLKKKTEQSDTDETDKSGSVEDDPNSKYKTAKGDYLVKKYKLNFSPDIISGNAGYDTFFGVQGTSIIQLSDMLGNHNATFGTDLFFDLKNSNYFFSYFYLPKRTDFGIAVYHQAYFFTNFSNPYGPFGQEFVTPFRLRDWGVSGVISRPFNKFMRGELSLDYSNVSQTYLDEFSSFPSQSYNVFSPKISLIKDTVLWGMTGPMDGSRASLSIKTSPKINSNSLEYTTAFLDYRKYIKVKQEYSFAFRFNSGASFGNNAERFFLGGVDNWMNQKFSGGIRDNLTDIFFSYFITPLRGAPYYALEGNRFFLTNFEFRYPFLRFMQFGFPLPATFYNVRGSLFMDFGAAWDDEFSNFKLTTRNNQGDHMFRDAMFSYGTGIQTYFLFFLARFDIAWTYDLVGNSKPNYLFSIGADF